MMDDEPKFFLYTIIIVAVVFIASMIIYASSPMSANECDSLCQPLRVKHFDKQAQQCDCDLEGK